MNQKETISNINIGLKNIQTNEQWYKDFLVWKESDRNEPISILKTNDPYSIDGINDSLYFDLNEEDDRIGADLVLASVFLCIKLREAEQETLRKIKELNNLKEKGLIIKDYFDLVERIKNSVELSCCVLILNDCMEKSYSLRTKGCVYDISEYYCCYLDLLRKQSIESIYFAFTLWREKQTNIYLKELLLSISKYINQYFYDYGKDPDMHLRDLNAEMDNKTILMYLIRWLEIIAFRTKEIIDAFNEKGYESHIKTSVDGLTEQYIISKYQILAHKQLFSLDDNHAYEATLFSFKLICWIKTIDIYYILINVFRIINTYDKQKIEFYELDKNFVEIEYNNLQKLRDFYVDSIYEYRSYYENNKEYIDTRIMEHLEIESVSITKAIDEIIKYIDSYNNNNIDGLTQAKYGFIKESKKYISKKQEEELNQITITVCNKIKEIVQKTDLYDEIYKNVSKEFSIYANELLPYPQILVSLVSAEYLYNQYVEKKEENTRFDYSCVSIMYFLALEDFINKLVYKPYLNSVLSKIDIHLLKDKTWKDNESKAYLPNIYKYLNNDKKSFKGSCEIGVIGNLFVRIKNVEKFKDFVELGFPNIDIERFSLFGQKLIDIAKRRNNAAHGDNRLEMKDALDDKHSIYEDSAAQDYRGLIIEFLNILFDE